MANCNESICRSCFHSYVCEQFNENKNIKNNKCHFFNDHFAPTSDVVEVKHGEWIKSIHKETPIIKDGRLFEKEHEVFCCSVCDVKIVGLRDMNFCPFCGAKMDLQGGADNGKQ